MKKLLKLLILTITITAQTQNRDRFTIGVFTEPLADKYTSTDKLDYAFNIGGRIEYQMNFLYFQAETFYFPELNGIDYFDYDGGVGLNFRNKFDDVRIYGGIKLGAIYRQGWGNPKWGFEVGADYYFYNNIFVGFQLGADRRTDGRVWENDAKSYWSDNLKIKLGYYW